MYTEEMPWCCTARVIGQFEPGQEWHGKQKADENTEGRIYNEIKQKLDDLKQDGLAVVIATTTNFQVNAEAALEALGFYITEKAITKAKHNRTQVKVWIMPLDEWVTADFPLRKVVAPKNIW